jgi:hypothetical protein
MDAVDKIADGIDFDVAYDENGTLKRHLDPLTGSLVVSKHNIRFTFMNDDGSRYSLPSSVVVPGSRDDNYPPA